MPRRSEEYRARRREQIIEAAVNCFARRGLHHTTMADIIAEAGLSAGAVYCYFASKNEIITAIAAERHREEAARLAPETAAPVAKVDVVPHVRRRDRLGGLIHEYEIAA